MNGRAQAQDPVPGWPDQQCRMYYTKLNTMEGGGLLIVIITALTLCKENSLLLSRYSESNDKYTYWEMTKKLKMLMQKNSK